MKVNDEMIISGLLTNGSVRATAKATGLSKTAIYERMKKSEFIAMYKFAKAEILRNTIFELNNHTSTAIQTIADIMSDTEANQAVRLQASQTILNTAYKFSSLLNTCEDDAKETADIAEEPWSI